MRVAALMTRKVYSCLPTDSLSHAAQMMWEHDFGCVPVVDGESRLVGIITDRDALMAAYTQGKTLKEISISSAMSTQVHACRPDDSVEDAQRTMSLAQVRRLPVEDGAGHLIGLLSLNDLARSAHALELEEPHGGLSLLSVAHTLAATCQPREATPPPFWAGVAA